MDTDVIVILVRKFRHLRRTCPAADIQVGFVQGRANSLAFTSVSSSRLLGNENPWPCPSSKVLQAAIRSLSQKGERVCTGSLEVLSWSNSYLGCWQPPPSPPPPPPPHTLSWMKKRSTLNCLNAPTVILNDKTGHRNVVSEAPRQMFFQKKQSDGNHSTNPKCIVAATN